VTQILSQRDSQETSARSLSLELFPALLWRLMNTMQVALNKSPAMRNLGKQLGSLRPSNEPRAPQTAQTQPYCTLSATFGF